MPVMTSELIDAILLVVNTNTRTTLSRGCISVAVVRNRMIEAGYIQSDRENHYVKCTDYVEPSGCTGCTDCGRHGDWGHLGLCNDCRASHDCFKCVACGRLSTDCDSYGICADCSYEAECLSDVQDADFAAYDDHTTYIKDTSRASFDDHEVCIGCGELTTCDEDNLCCRCGC